MKRRGAILAALVGLPIAAFLATAVAVSSSPARRLLAGEASRALKRPVRFASASLVPSLVPRLRLRRVEVAAEAHSDAAPLLTVERVDVRPRLTALLRGRLEIASIVLERPIVTPTRDAEGRWNVAGPVDASRTAGQPGSSGAAATEGATALRRTRIRIENGSVDYVRRGNASRLRLENLDVVLTTGSRIAFAGDARLQPGDLDLEVTDGTLTPNGAPLTAASLSAQVALQGDDVTDLFAALLGPRPAVGGALRGRIEVGGTLAAPTARGPLALSRGFVAMERPGCPEPQVRRLPVDSLSTTAEWSGGRLTGHPTIARVGDGEIRTNLSISLDGSGRVALDDLTIRGVDLEAVLVDFLCSNYAVTGRLGLSGRLAIRPRRAPHPLSGSGRLEVVGGKVVGRRSMTLLSAVLRVGGAVSALLSADVPRALLSSPLDFHSLAASYDVADGVLTVPELLYSAAAMKVSGAGNYDLASRQLDLDVVVHHGRGLAHARVTGAADSPSFRVTPSTALRDLDPSELGRGFGRGLQALIERLR